MEWLSNKLRQPNDPLNLQRAAVISGILNEEPVDAPLPSAK